jgi:hypothetical protein
VDYFDIVQQIVSILEDKTLQAGFLEYADVRGAGNDRVYGEMNTGTFWEETQKLLKKV